MANTTFDDVIESMSKYLVMREDMLDMIWLALATPISLRFMAKPAWIMIVGGPSTGKTESVKPCIDSDLIYWLDNVTPRAFMSGFRDEEKEKKTGQRVEASLVQKLKGKVLLMPDMTLVLGNGADSSKVMNQLRLFYDGQCRCGYGNDNTQTFVGLFNVLGCCTEAIDQLSANAVSLGERFLYFRLKPLSTEQRNEIGEKAIERDRSLVKQEHEAARKYLELLHNSRFTEPKITKPYVKRLSRMANFLACFRTSQHRDWHGGAIMAPPQDEGPSRIAAQLATIAKGMAAVKRREEITDDEMRICERLVLGTMPEVRRRSIGVLCRAFYATDLHTISKYSIMDALRISPSGADKVLYELYNIGLVDRNRRIPMDGESFSWELSSHALSLIEDASLVESIMVNLT